MKLCVCIALLAAGILAGCGGERAAAKSSHAENFSAVALYGWSNRYARFAGDPEKPNQDVALLIKVKSALWGAPDLKRFPIEVGVLNGVVTLYGEVDTVERRAMAERVAGEVRGVESVKSGIAITAPV
ncbi:MAG: hypothetical protein JWN94_2026 [Betaproteobacteria bacterium]|nr:hypothetical protein [Betaproteobacteria bacterium]